MSDDLKTRFEALKADEVVAAQMQHLREQAVRFGEVIEYNVPASRERSLALTKLEEVVFWANAGIARNG